jgi:hypothetical protein
VLKAKKFCVNVKHGFFVKTVKQAKKALIPIEYCIPDVELAQ